MTKREQLAQAAHKAWARARAIGDTSWDPVVDAFLAELREPDEYMRAAGFTALVGDQGGQVSAEEIWQAMIDAIK